MWSKWGNNAKCGKKEKTKNNSAVKGNSGKQNTLI